MGFPGFPASEKPGFFYKLNNFMTNKNNKYRILSEEYIASRIEKQQLSAESKKTLNEGRAVKGGGLVYGGFPRVIKEGEETESLAPVSKKGTYGVSEHGIPYPSVEFGKLYKQFRELRVQHQMNPKDTSLKTQHDVALKALVAHPDYDEFDAAQMAYYDKEKEAR